MIFLQVTESMHVAFHISTHSLSAGIRSNPSGSLMRFWKRRRSETIKRSETFKRSHDEIDCSYVMQIAKCHEEQPFHSIPIPPFHSIRLPHSPVSNFGGAFTEELADAQALLVAALHALLEAARVRQRTEHLQTSVRVFVHCYDVNSDEMEMLCS